MKQIFAFLATLSLLVVSHAIAQTNPRVQIDTDMGSIVLELDAKAAPLTAANFIAYVKEGFYEGTIFHRVIGGFMIQGGGLTPEMNRKPNLAPVPNEADNGLKNRVGTIAMARTQDPHSATSQFFINVADNAFLDHTSKTHQGWGYCVFGHVVEGMDVVRAIEKVPTTARNGHRDVPVKPIMIKRATIITEKAPAPPTKPVVESK